MFEFLTFSWKNDVLLDHRKLRIGDANIEDSIHFEEFHRNFPKDFVQKMEENAGKTKSDSILIVEI